MKAILGMDDLNLIVDVKKVGTSALTLGGREYQAEQKNSDVSERESDP